MRSFAIITLLLLTACATPPAPGSIVQIRWVEHDNITKKCGRLNAGCYEWQGPVCVIHTRKPRTIFDEQLHNHLGHETRHCFKGDFHPQPQYLDLSRIAQ